MTGRMATIRKNLEARAPTDRDCDELCDMLVKIDTGRYRLARKRKVASPRPVRPDKRARRRENLRLCAAYCTTMSAHLKDWAKAERLNDLLAKYRNSAWKNERALKEAPLGRHGPLWEILDAFDHVPCAKTISRRLKEMDKTPNTA